MEPAKNLLDSEIKAELTFRNGNTLLSLIPPQNKSKVRTPSVICCVIDNSGSMGDEAQIKSDDGAAEKFGFSIMDLVKHALRTIIQSLDSEDYLSLVTFSTEAEIVTQITKMDATGKAIAEASLDNIRPTNSTNIWAGLTKGMNLLKDYKKKINENLNASLMLLTDGVPNIIPPRGHIPMLTRYIEENGLPCSINTFGFGYSLDSKLLNELAVVGKGVFSFIPDGSFVGTIFINALSSILSTYANDLKVKIELNKIKIEDFSLVRNYNHSITENSLIIDIGSINYDQTKHIVLPIAYSSDIKSINIDLNFDIPNQKSINQKLEINIVNNDDKLVDVHRIRLFSVNEVINALREFEEKKNLNLKVCQELIKSLIVSINDSDVKNIKFIQDLLKDLDEQVTIAFSTLEFMNKWGRHYLLSLMRAHLLELCNNFKDPGVQNYAGETFSSIRDKLDDIFINLPAPKPSIKRAENKHISNMAVYYNSAGVCFGGENLVLIKDGSHKLIKELKKGDILSNGATVLCVVKTLIEEKKTLLTTLIDSGLKLTPWHPVKINNNFHFPCELEGITRIEECDFVYNFVLDRTHLMNVQGIECVTLGHGLKEKIVAHNYFGTDRVINDLKKINGWKNGFVEINNEWVIREEDNGTVSGINFF